MSPLPLILLLAVQTPQEPGAKPVPKDSVEIATRGCFKGHMFTATPMPEGEPARGPDVTGRHFHVSGPKDVMALVKQNDGHLVEIVGIVRKSALSDQGVGIKMGGTRMVIGAPGGDPGRMSPPTPGTNVPVMDLTSVGYLADTCPVR
jgi:hypothetical protein